MKNTQNPSIYVGMLHAIALICLLMKDHDVTFRGFCINGVLGLVNAICGIIDAHGIVKMEVVMFENDVLMRVLSLKSRLGDVTRKGINMRMLRFRQQLLLEEEGVL